jgi:hypothetical protein
VDWRVGQYRLLHTRRSHIAKVALVGRSFSESAKSWEMTGHTHHLLGNFPVTSFPSCDANISSLFCCSGPSGMWNASLCVGVSGFEGSQDHEAFALT